jgi:transcriptional regulator with XRE-family HTH domain
MTKGDIVSELLLEPSCIEKLPEHHDERKGSRPQIVDRHVGARMRQRRLVLGINQQQLAELIGVTNQQAHKYEKGINRISAGRLYVIAQALDVDITFFFEGLDDHRRFDVTPKRRLLLEFARNFAAVPEQRHQAALSSLVRALATSSAYETAAPRQARNAS